RSPSALARNATRSGRANTSGAATANARGGNRAKPESRDSTARPRAAIELPDRASESHLSRLAGFGKALQSLCYRQDPGGPPLALVLHLHPLHGGTMNNKLVYTLFQCFVRRGFSTLRFNFRGVGRSQGSFDRGEGELADAAAALDWLQGYNPNAVTCWVAGYS